MKALRTTLLAFISGAAISAAHAEPLPIDVIPPQGEGDGSVWQVSFKSSYIAEDGKPASQPAVTFNVASGQCATGASNIVQLKGDHAAKVTQKICVGRVNGKNVIVGWLVSPGASPKPFVGANATEYGTAVDFVFDGNYLEADQSIYHFKAVKQPSPIGQANDQ